MRWRLLQILFPLLACGALLSPAQSTKPTRGSQKTDDEAPLPAQVPWWKWGNATGTWFGVRQGLENRSIDVFGGYTYLVQGWSNLQGNADTQIVYSGMLDFGANFDLEKLVCWKGASISTTWLWINGNNVGIEFDSHSLVSSNIVGFNTFRMMDFWLQQELCDGKISLRAGQLTADAELVRSEYAALFMNSSFGWPAILYTNLPGGGPSLPMGTLGARLALHPTDWLTWMSAGFQGDVFDQFNNRYGFRWRLDGRTGFLFLNEVQVRWNHASHANGLPGQFKAGLWIQTGQMADALATATNSGNYGWYFILDQMLWRRQSGSDEGLGWFGRIMFADQDRNLAGFYFDTGISYTGLIPGRGFDTMGLALACVQMSSGARHNPAFNHSLGDGRQFAIEWTYQASLTPWLIIQPDVQFILTPAGTANYDNAIVFGGSVSIRF